MHLFFIDESGTPPKPTARNPRPYFVIAGIVVHEDQWHGIATEVRELCRQKRYQVDGEIKWRYFGPHNTDPDNSVRHLSALQRDEFRTDLFKILTQRKSVKIIACCASIAAAYRTKYVQSPEHLYHYTYKTVSERFQYHLQDLSKTLGSKQLGMIVADHRGKKQDEALRKEHLKFVDGEDLFFSRYQNFVEGLLLTPSHHSVGIQLADMVAGAIGRAFNTRHSTSPDSKFADQLKPAFRISPSGEMDGWGMIKFPKGTWE